VSVNHNYSPVFVFSEDAVHLDFFFRRVREKNSVEGIQFGDGGLVHLYFGNLLLLLFGEWSPCE
jgi:uncharacterized protein YigE (DUF2233 family)